MDATPKKYGWSEAIARPANLSRKVNQTPLARQHEVQTTAGTVLFKRGEARPDLMMLLSGKIRVEQIGTDGQASSISFARANPVQGSKPTYLFGFEWMDAVVVAETDVTVVLVPPDACEAMLRVSKDFRALAFAAYHKHIIALLGKIETRLQDQRHGHSHTARSACVSPFGGGLVQSGSAQVFRPAVFAST